jgi:hypothetical protein
VNEGSGYISNQPHNQFEQQNFLGLSARVRSLKKELEELEAGLKPPERGALNQMRNAEINQPWGC